MYPNIERIFFSKENSDEDVGIKPALQFQNHHFIESVPKCSQSRAISDSLGLQPSTRLDNPISNLNQSQFDRRNSSQPHSTAQKEKKKEREGEGEGGGFLLLSKENSKLKAEEEEEEEEEEEGEEEGFRTPTTLDQRIPEAKQCPPAPRKPKPSLKRKAPHTLATAPIYLSSKEVQLLFPVQHNPLSDSLRITKKIRRDDPN
ncbi:uncharacterized protein LOC129291722 [Prosopis cineraria]|uniref:uncharacterized protein LOC129291722 n=1 Tax=Prosopis cineraria TaxID=364024 RepID=UPI002410207E|nr:uncharacterized protein LOC129291722 [Prosopis cineraria]